jgi:HSP20 family protein
MVGVSSVSSHVDWVPNTDIYENEQAFVIRMEIAGVKREDIQIHISDRNLIVTGIRPDQCESGRRQFRQMEINYGVFERRLVLPRSIESKKVKANYRHGLLIIELPKVSKSDPAPLKVTIDED